MSGIAQRYQIMVEAGELRPDVDQRMAMERLRQMADALEAADRAGSAGGGLFGLFKRKSAGPVIRHLYLWGGVGRGKSMIMDMFFDCLNIKAKRRVHFHAFMLEVHDRIRQARTLDKGDPIPIVARDLARDLRLLAFDEMQVNNIADAMILSRLFTALLEQGVTVVTTSNRHPRDLYKNGLNRAHFLPFIDLLEAQFDIMTLNGPVDYRLERLTGVKTWHSPADAVATASLSEAFFRLTDYPVNDKAHVPSEDLEIPGGRIIHVPKSFKGVGVFSFKRLCAEARGAADYLALAQHFHTLIIVAIPIMGPQNRNEAARFVTLIDALYEHRVKLLAAAAAAPASLYPTGDGAFEFERTVSRLMEMQSADYLALGHGEAEDEPQLATEAEAG
ncbi:cell division protein ZapE [Aquisediminimonas sediminicola]|uniref:cell division protein ZapE n=1 Tax=Alteraquisediminimonas sediminicola TaxID=2676787 RepID=UPI001C8DA9A1|nr:cell division protein ZapE [Aquisediminimonas sediminicola]